MSPAPTVSTCRLWVPWGAVVIVTPHSSLWWLVVCLLGVTRSDLYTPNTNSVYTLYSHCNKSSPQQLTEKQFGTAVVIRCMEIDIQIELLYKCQLIIWVMLMPLCSWNYAINILFIQIQVTGHFPQGMCLFIVHLRFLCYSFSCVLSGRPTCCWTGAVQRFPRWGRWVTGWMEWGPCPARRPSLGSATAPVTPWPRPPQSKTTTHTDTHTKLLCLFMSAVFTGPQHP